MMQPSDKASLFHELAKLVQADFHIDRTIALLLKQRPSPVRKRFLESLQHGLDSGQSVSNAARTLPGLLSGLDLALIEAGEHSGQLAQSFQHLARYYETLDQAQRQAHRAMIYPLVLAHLAILLPAIPAAIQQQHDFAAGAARVGLTLAAFWGVLLLLRSLWRSTSHAAETSQPIERILLAIPFVGSVRRHWALARFTQVFHSGLLAAVRPQQLLRLAGDASGSSILRAGAQQAANAVATGEPIADSLRLSPNFPQDFVDAIDSAEQAGSLDAEMRRWAQSETASAADATDRAAIWLPKIAYALIVLFVAYRILTMAHGIYGGLLDELDG